MSSQTTEEKQFDEHSLYITFLETALDYLNRNDAESAKKYLQALLRTVKK